MEGQPIVLQSRIAFALTLCVVMLLAAAYVGTRAWQDSTRTVIALASLVVQVVTLWKLSARVTWTDGAIHCGYLFGAVRNECFRMGDLTAITVLRSAGGQVSRVTLHFPTGKLRLSRLQSGYGVALARLRREWPFELEHAGIERF